MLHVDHTKQIEVISEDENGSNGEVDRPNIVPMNEWELLSQMGLANSVNLNEFGLLGKRDFNNTNRWDENNVPSHLHETIIQFVKVYKTLLRHIHYMIILKPTYHIRTRMSRPFQTKLLYHLF